jgi:hypothetical protein
MNVMVHKGDLEERRQRAAQLILESDIVTSALDYDEAEVVLNWALSQVESVALSSGEMADDEAEGYIAQGVGKVRRLMKMVNDLVEDRYDLSGVETVEKLTQLLSVAMDAPTSEVD